ncbi:ABC transporter permease [Solwaraspora sp. WMMD406]|uniref:ABC transporter permease n=1 Tax=Solwaraspora sp. WMMD406 TaxID=3016095 RepID=UPI002415A7DF|nr:ABC transporter permease [Solwaraspora sp. WMMD406]MDG4767143.1 ABC transporter permease [Solwaraspora sp. WMMD406]
MTPAGNTPVGGTTPYRDTSPAGSSPAGSGPDHTRAATGGRGDPADRAGRRRPPDALLGLAGLVGLLALAQILPATPLVSSRYLPPATEIVAALIDLVGDDAFWTALGSTLTAWAIGLAIAVGAGVGVGVLIGSVPLLRAATASTIEFLRPIPSVALIPLAVLLFGTGIESSLLLVVYAAFWQVLVQVLYGVQDVDPVADETARSYGLGTWARVRHVVWPTALPYVLTGVRLAAAVALVLAITAELVIGAPGLGNRIAVAQTSGAVPLMYALVVVTGLLGVAINLVARAVERRVLSWHQSMRAEVAG